METLTKMKCINVRAISKLKRIKRFGGCNVISDVGKLRKVQ